MMGSIVDTDMVATCGHDDPLGYLTGLPCAACTREAHNKAMGKG
jgi:hypothetical protein